MAEDDDKNPGGGSGGDAGMTGDGHQLHSARGTYHIGGNQVVLVSRKNLPPAPDNKSRITLLAAGGLPEGFTEDGKVDIRGTKGVRITAGPVSVPEISPPVDADTTDGVEIMVSETQYVTIYRGISPLNQKIEMMPGGIMIDAGISGMLTLKAGASQIIINAEGITIQGLPLVQIN